MSEQTQAATGTSQVAAPASGDNHIDTILTQEDGTATKAEFLGLVSGKTLAEVNALLKAGVTANEPKPDPDPVVDWATRVATKPFEGMDTTDAQKKLDDHKAETQPAARM